MKIDINSGKSISDLLSPKLVAAMETAVSASLALVHAQWQYEAQKQLRSTLPLYLLGLDINSVIYPLNDDGFSGAVELQGTLPNMLEKGFSAFDMKTGFSRSSKKVTTKSGGWYLTIPMRHSTPGSYLYGKPMPSTIYSQAKKLGNGESLSVKGNKGTSWTGYQHKSNIHDGLTRIIKSYSGSGAKQSQYFTFRRVSSNSESNSWQHPGYPGVKIQEKLLDYASTVFKQNVERALSSIT